MDRRSFLKSVGAFAAALPMGLFRGPDKSEAGLVLPKRKSFSGHNPDLIVPDKKLEFYAWERQGAAIMDTRRVLQAELPAGIEHEGRLTMEEYALLFDQADLEGVTITNRPGFKYFEQKARQRCLDDGMPLFFDPNAEEKYQGGRKFLDPQTRLDIMRNGWHELSLEEVLAQNK